MKFSFKNRYGLNIVGDISVAEDSVGCAFVLHGLGGKRTQEHIQTLAETLFSNGYTVVNFDATNSIGESEGKYEDVTMQRHYEDLADVIEWARSQEWFKEPFVLTGHSLGGYAVARYAEEYPTRVKGVFPFAPVVSGKLNWEATERFEPGKIQAWRETGWMIRTSKTRPDLELRLPWSHMEERLTHDLQKGIGNLTMPILIVVGKLDWPCPPDHQKLFLDMIPSVTPKELHIIKGAPHTFREKEHLDQLGTIFGEWLKKI
ncbi:MAG: alpha/beta fold hydrolase [Patescibacteria group bacterium]